MNSASITGWAGRLLLALAVSSLAAACGKYKEAPEGSAGRGDSAQKKNPLHTTPSPWKTPARYEAEFREYRKSWSPLTGYQFSGLHWNQYIALYVNKDADRYVRNYLEYVRLYVNEDGDAEETSVSKFEPYAEGTIFLKENFLEQDAKPGPPASITAMIKMGKGFDPGANDWQFLQWDTEGRILIGGSSRDAPTRELCIKCHASMAERDFVFSTFCNIAGPAD